MLSIERFAGAFALCEDAEGRRVTLLRAKLPEEAREGDLLLWEGRWRIDAAETAARRAAIRKRQETLLRRG